jgi:hypothetical protein
LRLCEGGFNEQDAQLVLHTDSRLFDRPLDGLFDLGASMNDFLLMVGGALFVVVLSFLFGFISAWVKDKNK